MSDTPEPIVANYLKIGSRTFAVQEIDVPNLDINEELRQAYELKHQEFKANYGQGIIDDLREDWSSQIDHLRAHEQRSTVTVPPDLTNENTILAIRNGRVLPCRVLRYQPTRIDCHWEGLPRNFKESDHTQEVKRHILRTVHEDNPDQESPLYTNVQIEFSSPISFPLVVAYDQQANNIYSMGIRYFHSYSDGRICTGNHSAHDFWRHPNFTETMNFVNWHSPACNYVVYEGREHPLYMFLNDGTITGVSIHRQEESWRT